MTRKEDDMKRQIFWALVTVATSATLPLDSLAEDAYLESSGGTGINSRYFFNPKSRVEVDFALTDTTTQQQRVWGMDATSPMGSLYVQGTLNVAFGSGDTFVNSDTLTLLPCDTLRHTAVLDVAQRVAAYTTGGTTSWTNGNILATHAPTTTATVPIGIFAGTSNNRAGTLFGNPAKMRLYRIKFFTDGVLVHDYLPCVKGGVPGLRDQVDGVFVTSENVGALSVGGDVEVIEDDPWIALPDNNQTNGWQFVDTGYRPTPNTRFEVDYALLKNYESALSGNGDWVVFSGYSSVSNNALTHNYSVFNLYYNKGGAAWSCGGDDWIGPIDGFPKPVDDKDIRRRAVLDAKNKTLVLATAGFTNYTGTCTGYRDFNFKTVKIGAWYHGSSGFAPLKIYGCRIYEDDVLVRDLRPCVQNGLAGLKDEMDGDFLACGTRTYGGSIPHEQGDGYIESKTRNCYFDTGYYANSNTCIWADWAFTSRDNSSAAGGQHFVFESTTPITARIYGNGSGGAASDTSYAWNYSTSGQWISSEIRVVTNVRHQAYIDAYGDRVLFMSGSYTNYYTTMTAKGAQNQASNTKTLKLFSNANGTGNFALMRLYGFKIWDTGTLVRDYIPYIKGGTVGLYDRVSGTFMTGNRLFAYGGNIANDGSTVDAYIEGDGTQTISTGVTVKPGACYEVDYQFTRVQGQARVFGTAQSNTGSAELYVQGSSDGSGYLAFGHGKTWANTGSASISAGDLKRRKGVFDLTTRQWTLGEFSGTINNQTEGTSTFPIGLFAKTVNDAGTSFQGMGNSYNPPDYAQLRIYFFRIYEYVNGVKTLTHEFLPYKKGNVVGVYDTQTGEVKTNGIPSGNDLKINGKGVEGAERWLVSPQGGRLTKRAGSMTISANAVGAVSYRWTRNGEAIAGGEDGDLTVEWEKAKVGTVETYAAVPIYDICGNSSEGVPVSATVEHLSAGTLLLFR